MTQNSNEQMTLAGTPLTEQEQLVAAQETQGKKSKAAKKAAKPEPEVTPFVVYNAESGIKEAALTDLLPLDSTPIDNAAYAMRVINKQHLDHLIASLGAGDSFPALKVVNTNMGYVVIDGYHRWASYEENLRNILEESGDVDEATLLSARQAFFIPVEEIQVNSHRDMLNAAFKANLEHGLPASTDSRVRYALWMLEENRHNGGTMSLREAGRLAHCTHQAIMKAAKKLQNATKKMVDVQLTDDEQAEADAIAADDSKANDAASLADKHMTNVLKAVKYFSDNAMTSSEMSTYAESYAAKTTKEQIAEIFSLLSYINDKAPFAPRPEATEVLNA